MKTRSIASAGAVAILSLCLGVHPLCRPHSAFAALSVHAGGGAVSGGDDKPRPLAQAGFMAGPGIYATLFAYGERFSIVSKQTQILSVGKQWAMPSSFTKRLAISGGVSTFRERTTLAATGDSEKLTDESYNFGANLGLRFRLLAIGPGFLDFDWNAHVFPAGLATIFLATGRRQTLTLTTGMGFK